MKLSMGKDFFDRTYDRLSPSSDRTPRWYCEPCSMHKNLQRDVRDIRIEWDKLNGGQTSLLTESGQLQRARLRLQEIAAVLATDVARSGLVDIQEVNDLMQHLHTPSSAIPSSATSSSR